MKNKKKALNILQNDCKAFHYYLTESGCTCAIGALARNCGVSDDTLKLAHTCSIQMTIIDSENTQERLNAVKEIRDSIFKKFGLTIGEMRMIQCHNDSITGDSDDSIAKRREKVVKVLMPLTDDPD